MTKLIFRALTALALFGGTVASGLTSVLGNPIAGILSLSAVFLWDIRDLFKFDRAWEARYLKDAPKEVREKVKEAYEEHKRKHPASHGYTRTGVFLAVRCVLFFVAGSCAFLYSRAEVVASVPAPGTTYHDLFWSQLDKTHLTTADNLAIAAGAFAFLYGLFAVILRVLDYVLSHRKPAAST